MLKFLVPLIFTLFIPWVNSLIITIVILIMIFFIFISNMKIDIFYVDNISLILVFLSLFVTILIVIVPANVKKPLLYYNTIIFLNFILIGVFIVNSRVNFYVLFEVSLIPTLFLIVVWGYTPERIEAGLFLIIYTVTVSLPFLFALFLYYKINNSFYIILNNPFIPYNSIYYSLWCIFIIFAFLVKLPIYRVHLWLPKAHLEAPVVGSIILAGILLKLGGYGLLRFSYLYHNYIVWSFIIGLGLWGGLLTRIVCLRQIDLKALIAYSSVGHISLIIAAIFSGREIMKKASLIIIIAHGLCSSGLFFIGDFSYKISGSRAIIINKGLLIILPNITFFWFLLTAANIAAPPSLNLLREITLFIRIIILTKWLLFPIVLIIFFSGCYSLYLFVSLNHGTISRILNLKWNIVIRYYLVVFLHSFPLFFLILKINYIF